jgi:hypothetical protein
MENRQIRHSDKSGQTIDGALRRLEEFFEADEQVSLSIGVRALDISDSV